MTFYKYNVKSK